jgi:hypothetical protein
MKDGRNLMIWLFFIVLVLGGLAALETILEVPNL